VPSPVSKEMPIQFSLVAGGPFHKLLLRLGLLGQDGLPGWRTAFVLALLAWMPPAILAIAQTLLHADYSGWEFFRDGTVYTRYLVAIIAMVITERFADGRISVLVNQFLQARLIAPDARERFMAIVSEADRKASWPLMEGMLLLLALAWSGLSFYFVSMASVSGWEEWVVGGETRLSWAGTAAELVSNPVFLFLVLRWFWRFLVWTLLLARISSLPLRLNAMHPDRAGGLMFLTLFPGMFGGFVFALSCVVSSSLVKSVALLAPSQLFIWFTIGAWVALMALVFLAPLFVFAAPLFRVREQAMIECGRIAQVHHQEFHKVWMTGDRKAEELLGNPDPSSVADINASVQTALDMHIVPLDRAAVLQILVAAAAPFLLFLATQVPIAEVVKWIIGTIF
jgi:hypothetical protein